MSISVAVVKPIFTSTPYYHYPHSSFYAFYIRNLQTKGNITDHLELLRTSVDSGMNYFEGWGHSVSLYTFLGSDSAKNCGLVLGKNLKVINDIDVSQGALFGSNGKRLYDAVIIGHQEYVTEAENEALRNFVATGGKLIAMSANALYVKVSYDPATRIETFVSGHDFAFNGKTAWHSKAAPFLHDPKGWFGSFYCCSGQYRYNGGRVDETNAVGKLMKLYFGATMSDTYRFHEEDGIANYTRTSIVATFTSKGVVPVVAAYTHEYGKGMVLCLCIFGEDLIAYDRSTQFFLIASLMTPLPAQSDSSAAGLPWVPFHPHSTVLSPTHASAPTSGHQSKPSQTPLSASFARVPPT